MRSDDQLAHDLADAFRDATADLTYSGAVPTPRRGVPMALPAVAVAVAAGGVALAVSGHGRSAPEKVTPAIAAVGPSTSSAVPSPVAAVRTQKLSLAGYTFSYPLAAGKQPLSGTFVATVPAGATRVQTTNPAQDWIGVDPTTGRPTAYVDPGRGTVLAISSPDATRDELIAMLTSDVPRAIPVVSPPAGSSEGQ